MLKYSFFKFESEKRISVEDPFQMLSDLSNCNLSYSIDVIQQLTYVLSGKTSHFSWGGSDFCIIESYPEKSIIEYNFGESTTEIATGELFRLISDWKMYLELDSN